MISLRVCDVPPKFNLLFCHYSPSIRSDFDAKQTRSHKRVRIASSAPCVPMLLPSVLREESGLALL